MSESETVTKDEIFKKLRKFDEEENKFQFSKCRERYIVVIGSKSTARHILGNAVRRDQFDKLDYAQKSETFLMVPDDPTCNICIVKLIELQPLENYKPPPDKKSQIVPSPMPNIDRAIHRYATKIHLIFFHLQCIRPKNAGKNDRLCQRKSTATGDHGFGAAALSIL